VDAGKELRGVISGIAIPIKAFLAEPSFDAFLAKTFRCVGRIGRPSRSYVRQKSEPAYRSASVQTFVSSRHRLQANRLRTYARW